MLFLGMGLILLGLAAFIAWPKAEANPTVALSGGASGSATVPAEVDYAAPSLTLFDLTGTEHSLVDYQGQVVLVNLWATWCPPCRAEMPTLEAYFQDHRKEGFTLIGIEAGDARDEVAEFVAQYDLSFPVWLDPQSDSLRGFYNASLPNSYVIDRQGTVVLGWTGAISREMLEKHVTPLLEN